MDDDLYDQFRYEVEHGVPHPDDAHAADVDELLSRLDDEQEREMIQLQQQVHPRNAHIQLPGFVDRRPYLRFVLRNLLILDHILMVLFLPFSLFTIFKALLCEVTFSQSDILTELADYIHNRIVVDTESSTVYLYRSGMGLLGKFHNSVVYHSAPCFKLAMLRTDNSEFIRQLYTVCVKWYTCTIYISYGVLTSTYLCFFSFFFMVCLTFLCIKRYKVVEQVMVNIYQTRDLIF